MGGSGRWGFVAVPHEKRLREALGAFYDRLWQEDGVDGFPERTREALVAFQTYSFCFESPRLVTLPILVISE